ncbi:MAG: response regulator transcription factor [Stagnimonas sp.]|nr:response regulator transcription factor [Stagnimonas sp.]
MRVLVIEDHPDLAANLGDFLSAQGHSVDFAADGPGGLTLAQAGGHDVIVLDRMLPGMDGATLCKKLRAQGNTTPVLMLTALDTVANRVEGLVSGADDYLVKPFALSELSARLNALHRRASGWNSSGAKLQVADLMLDPETAEAHRGNVKLDLTRAERRLLEILLRRSPKLVSRAELERVLWGDDAPDGDVLRAHMHNLRNAVDKPFEHKLIHTVHGEGYRLIAATS